MFSRIFKQALAKRICDTGEGVKERSPCTTTPDERGQMPRMSGGRLA
jgi:hypothetical protein